ncbi:MAG: hypothetical protein L0211_26460 [Planctomycetaceae bacterium]|nr:hypothetical protein [Planctomycetaceae bacterium]
MQSVSPRAGRPARVLFVAALVAAGAGLALPFRRAGQLTSPSLDAAVVDVPLRRADIAIVAGPPGEVSPAAALDDTQALAASGRREPRPDLASLASPPVLPQDFDLAGAVSRPAIHRDWKPARLKLNGSQPALRRHRLTDGDTLERLAERYLGNPARGVEIFAMNRDLLTAPDLLPLGKIIRIPPAEQDEVRDAPPES